MYKKITILMFLIVSAFSGCAQQTMADYIGEWEGKTEMKNAFSIEISIKKLNAEDAIFILSNNEEILTKNFRFGNKINFTLDKDFSFSGTVKDGQSEINGFIKSKRYLYPTKLYRKGERFVGKWNLSVHHHLQPQSLRLTIKDGGGSDDEYRAYPILANLWCDDFKKNNNLVSFRDNKTGLEFEGQLKPSKIILNISLGGKLIAKTSFERHTERTKFSSDSTQVNIQINDGWELSKNLLSLPQMEEGILNDSLEGIESILVAKKGKITYEKYFAGFNANIPHTLMSASKSISSAIIGIAIDENIIESVDQKLYDYIPEKYEYTKDALKSKITIKDLLTMSSGLDVNKLAYEEYYQESNNWFKTVLEAPMKNEPGTYADYGSANPFLLGVYLSERLEKPLETYMDEKLFAPLGITNYINLTDDTETRPYFGGGMRLTPRDMLKFGQLYLNRGIWNGKRIISENWVDESFKKHVQLQDRNKVEYGYLWWHDSNIVDGKKIESIEARGAGGQRIIIIPDLESVVVITAGNFRNRKSYLSGEVFKEYILSAIKN